MLKSNALFVHFAVPGHWIGLGSVWAVKKSAALNVPLLCTVNIYGFLSDIRLQMGWIASEGYSTDFGFSRHCNLCQFTHPPILAL